MSGVSESTPRGGFSPATLVALVAVGVFSFAALVVLATYAPDMSGKGDPGAHGLSRSAVGYSGMITLLRGMGQSAQIARGPVNTAQENVQLMVLTIDEGDPRTALRGLPTTRNYPWPILAVLPKWETRPSRFHLGWVDKAGLRHVDADTWIGPGPGPGENEERDEDEAPDAAPKAPVKPVLDDPSRITLDHRPGLARHRLIWVATGAVIETGPIDRLQVFKYAPGFEALITDEQGGVVLARSIEPSSTFYALSEPDLLNNQGIAELANARAGATLLNTVMGGRQHTTYFDVTLNGLGANRSLVKLALEPPFVAATLCVVFALGLIGWNAFNRFGPARRQGRVFALGKRALADNQAGLFRMTRREPRLAGRYVQVTRDLAAQAAGAPRNLDEAALDRHLDRLAQHRGAENQITALSAEAAEVQTADGLTAFAGRLYRWRRAVSGGRG